METTVAIDFVDDFEVKLHPAEGVYLREWVPGGDDIIVDNFNDELTTHYAAQESIPNESDDYRHT